MTTKHQDHILFSYSFDDEGKAVRVVNNQASSELKTPDLSWVHLDVASKVTKKWLQNEVNYLDSIVIDALTTEETRPRILKFDNGMLLILRGINNAKNSKNFDMVSLRIWIDNQRVISIQRRQMKSIFEMQHKIDNGLNVKNSGDFLHNFLTITLQNISEYIYSIGEKIDEIEEKVLSTRDAKYRNIIAYSRSHLTISRRYLSPLKEVINNLRNCNYDWIDDLALRHFQENYDKITRVIEEIDEVISRSKILHDELAHALNEKINNNMFKLSMIAIIFMPLTFITSLFGMNFSKIPLMDNPYGFYATCGIMVIITIAQLFFFKKKDWF